MMNICICTAPQRAPAHPTSSPVPVADASLSLGPVILMMTVGTAPMSQPHAVRGMAGKSGLQRGGEGRGSFWVGAGELVYLVALSKLWLWPLSAAGNN